MDEPRRAGIFSTAARGRFPGGRGGESRMWRRFGTLALVICAIACAPPERAVEAPKPAPALPVDGGVLVRHLSTDVGTLNLVMHSTQSEKLVLSYLYDPLLDFNDRLEIIPGLAREWTVSDDHLTWTFKLDPAATFSDGKPVRAADVVFTLRKIVDPKAESVQLAGMFEGLDLENTKPVDEKTVQVVFKSARPSQIYAFNIGVLPEHVYAKGNFTKAFTNRAVGTGPYVLVKRDPGREIVLERRDDYWREKPYILKIVFKVIGERAQAWNALRTGAIDETVATTDQWLEDRDDPQFNDRIEFHRFYELGYNFIPWNNRDPILSDSRVRRALTMCLDRRLIVEKLYYGTARILTGPFTPNHWAFNPSVGPIEFDPQSARKLLADAGWKDSDGDGLLDRDGVPFKIEMILASSDTPGANQAQIFQQDLQRVGVQLTIAKIDGATLISRVLAGDFQATMLAWSLDLDPDLYSMFHSAQAPPNGQNFVFYANPAVDALIEEGRTTFDQGRRVEIYRELHRILAEDQP
ncbi:MAG TPA: ABC transporter substrate-binding protein, partial [Thermoanaerobaculia bacterium]|nr:ABC transporter substrate-binding protein [Thermoanaerobaculia bacterium]